ncbi:GNAT family N-acetyltransferase [Emcibacter nanhaiensis]|uniref:GNAT family N-acetyltransferase n=1 Tax=Emcibacter nanhaiensis TaxID=1505037 RepID=A0A501PBR2_9PROT|nr:GNAT family N-acetyltransferase [Emcibacter nanhaiensis]TPD57416.1 GNAT family N-acetyltransferase [Emcibacter nanhaiensis]
MDAKKKYRELCRQEKTIPLFNRDWWLDSVCGENNWDVSLVEKKDAIVAALPYILTRKLGIVVIRQPKLTQCLGPWIRQTDAKYSKKIGHENSLIGELYDQLPKFDYYSQAWNSSCTNWLALYWRGFSQTTRYTYVIEGLSDLEKVFADFESSYRNKIRKADKLVSVSMDLDIDEFYDINMLTFKRQGLSAPYSREFIRRHDRILSENNARKIFYARDEEGRIHSALYLTWDDSSSYVHMVGEDPDLRNSGAGILLIWKAIQYTANELGLDNFDFEGSMLTNVERVRRDCGGQQKPYFYITKYNSRLLRFKDALKALLTKGHR